MSDHVTWLIVVKNGMPYLPETLASISIQTYKNWEVLVWDNGSTDGTLEELDKWIPSRLPGRVIADKPTNVGTSRAELVQLSTTELCAIIDADDINLPERLEKQVGFLAVHPEVAVVGSQMHCINARGDLSRNLYTVPIEHNEIVDTMLHQNSIAQPSVLFRRSAILRAGNYRYQTEWNGVNIEDYDLWMRVAANNYKLANLDLPLVKYRIHPRSTTQQSIRNNSLESAMNFCFSKNSSALFGCTEHEAELLRSKRNSLAIKTLFKIASHLQKTQGGSLFGRLFSNSFIESGKKLVAPRDIVSRLFLSGVSQQKLALPQEVLDITKSAALTLPWLRKTVYTLHQFRSEIKQRKHLGEWLKEQTKSGANIHPSIEFTGTNPLPLDLVELHPECMIERDVSVWLSPDVGADPKLELKHKVFIGRSAYIGVFQPITIGQYTQIGAYSYIISANHCYETRALPIMEQGFVGAPIVIEDEVWLGTHVVVLPGVTIGKGAIVAAHSLVNKDIPPYEVWGGVPAKFLKHRPL